MKILLPIVGVVLMSLLVDILLPSGQVNKFIKGIFSLVLIIVVITPLVSLLNSDYEPTLFNSSSEIEIDYDYAEDVWSIKNEEKERLIFNLLSENGYTVESVEIEGGYSVDKVTITLSIGDSSTIKDLIFSNIGIAKERIYVVYE